MRRGTSSRPHSTLATFALLGVLLVASFGPATAHGGAPLRWTARPAMVLPHAPLTALDCPTATACLAANELGEVVRLPASLRGGGADPPAPAGPQQVLRSISCPTVTWCAAAGSVGNVAFGPSSGRAWRAWNIDLLAGLEGISCPSISLCVAVDDSGDVLASTNPRDPLTWSLPFAVGRRTRIDAVSCASTRLCAAVNDAGDVLISTDPANARAWRTTALAPGVALSAVSCVGRGRCVAVARTGAVYATAAAASPPVTWSATTIDPGAPLSAVSCSPVALCAALDPRGNAFETDDPSSDRPSWRRVATPLAPGSGAISCRAIRFCMAVDSAGRAVAAPLPGPTALTGDATVVSQTTALLAARVDPGDANVVSCEFEYGTGGLLARRVPCSPAPRAASGDQAAAARLRGLRAGTSYAFRVLVTTGAGSAAGDTGEFVTPAALTASPSLVGTPGVGSVLTCEAGVAAAAAPSASTTVAFAWLSNGRPIPGATASSYTPTAADAGDHLQCQVSVAGDGATTTAASGFDAIPQERGPAPKETTMGPVTWRGPRVSVRTTCSPLATLACTLRLRLIATTVHLGLRVRTSVGAANATLAPGATRTLTVRLGPRGIHLLERRGALAVTLRVGGTIIGTLNARLMSRRIVLVPSPAR